MQQALRFLAVVAGVAVLVAAMIVDEIDTFAGVLAPWIGATLIVIGLMPSFSMPRSSRSTSTIGGFFAVIVLVLAAQLARMQVFRQDSYARRSGADPETGEVLSNPRLISTDLVTLRGTLFDRNEAIIAKSEFAADALYRNYPEPDLAHFAGYFSPLLYGKTELEESRDDNLAGRAFSGVGDWIDREVLDRAVTGQNLKLTVDLPLQRMAVDALAERPGAIVLMDAKSGAVLAIASSPAHRVDLLAVTREEQIEDARAYWQQLVDDPLSPLLLRATMGLYPPGSTFKVITASAAIDSGYAEPESVFEDAGSLEVDGRVIIEQNRPDESVDEWTLAEGLAYSLNIVFAQIGLNLGAETLSQYASAFGFGRPFVFDVPVAESQISSSESFLETDAAVADTAFGQGELLVSPIQMATVAAAVANGGVLMRPFLVSQVTAPDGEISDSVAPTISSTPITNMTADQVSKMMIGAVEFGFASAAAVPGLVIGGKTGTAEVEGAEPHSWFIGFCESQGQTLAVSVVLEHAGLGTGEAAGIGGQLLAAAVS